MFSSDWDERKNNYQEKSKFLKTPLRTYHKEYGIVGPLLQAFNTNITSVRIWNPIAGSKLMT